MRKCKADRAACSCPAYHFPHRHGSGLCGREDELMWAARAKWEAENMPIVYDDREVANGAA